MLTYGVESADASYEILLMRCRRRGGGQLFAEQPSERVGRHACHRGAELICPHRVVQA